MKQEQLLVGLGRWGGPIREDFHGAFRTGPGVGPVRRKRADLVDLKPDIEFDRSENLFIGPLDGNATDGRQAVLRHEHGVIGVELHDGVDIRGVQGVLVALQLSGNGGPSAFVGLRRTRGNQNRQHREREPRNFSARKRGHDFLLESSTDQSFTTSFPSARSLSIRR